VDPLEPTRAAAFGGRRNGTLNPSPVRKGLTAMRGSSRRRPRAAISLFLAAALAAGTLGTGAVAAHADGAPPPLPPSSPLEAASQQAVATGQPVTVDSMTTETTIVVAEPDGSVQMTSNPQPVRVQKSGSWAAVSASLTANGDGTYSPAATPSGLTLSGGGAGPLVTMTDPAGQSLAVTFPFTLPTPSVSGDTATYSNVLPDVDLEVIANSQGGFSDLLVVKDAAAAADPALATLNLTTTTNGLAVSADSAGNIDATAPDGTVAFQAPTPMMWDTAAGSGTTPSAAAERQAATLAETGSAGATDVGQTTPIPVSDSGSTLTLTPPSAALTGTGVNYPVYIDPAINPASSGTYGYAEAKEGCAQQTNYDSPQPNGEGVGYVNPNYPNDGCTGVERSYYQIDTSNLTSAMVISKATLLTSETYGSDQGCSNTHPVTVHWTTAGIGPKTDWDTKPGINVNDVANTQTPKTAWCAAQDVDFDVTKDLQKQITISGQQYWTFALYGDESETSGNIGFMRFATNPSVTTVFDITPNVPTNTTATINGVGPINPSTQGCDAGPYGWIGASSKASVSLSGTLVTNVQGENAHAIYTVWDNNANNTPTGSNVLSNVPLGPTVPSGNASRITINGLLDGHHYGFRAYDDDGILTSAPSADCHFDVDLTPPILNTSAIKLDSGNTGKYAHQPWTFDLSATDPAPTGACAVGTCSASGIQKITWSLTGCGSGSGASGTITAASGTAAVTPCSWGTNQLVIQAYDNAGNESQPYTYLLYAPDNPNPTPIIPGDIDGTTPSTPDLLSTTSTGGLEVYPGGADPDTSGYQAAAPAQAPNGVSWTGALLAHRGAFGVLPIANSTTVYDLNVDDLWALQKVGTAPKSTLFLYSNTGSGQFTSARSTSIPVPSCNQSAQVITTSDPNYPCDAYDATDWSNIQQIVATTDVTGQGGKPDLLAVTEDKCTGSTCASTTASYDLWLYYGGSNSHLLANPVLIGQGGWNNNTLISPGVTTSSGRPDLWARNNSTGNVYLYTNTLQTAPDGSTQVPVGLGSGSADTKISTSDSSGNGVFTAAAYPGATADGATDSAGHPILWLTAADGTLEQSTLSGGTLSAPAPVTQPGWASSQPAAAAFPLNDDNTARAIDTSGNNLSISTDTAPAVGSMNSTTPVNDPNRGWTDQFNGSSSSITTQSAVLDTTKSYTVSAWVNLANANSTYSVVSQSGTNIGAFFLGFDGTKKTWCFYGYNGDVNSSQLTAWPGICPSSAAPTLNTWTHLVGVYDAGQKMRYLYVNGVLIGSGADNTAFATSGPLTIGAQQFNGKLAFEFPGQISDVEVYNSSLSGYQVGNVYTGQSPATSIS
jgi:hypothetical protein